MAHLLEWFYLHHNDTESFRYVWDCMAACQTGDERIPTAVFLMAQLLFTKLEQGFHLPEGTSDMNDGGIVLLLDGQYFVVAVFVRNTNSETQVAEAVKQLLAIYPIP